MMRRVPVTVTWLEMTGPGQLQASARVPDRVQLVRQHGSHAAEIAAAMYRQVGGPWAWRDRLPWSALEWERVINRPEVELWTAEEAGVRLGYFELERSASVVELKYFGLAPEAMGRGLGGWLLTEAVRRAWALGARRVEVNTCTLDGPRALPNYLARGFKVVREEQQVRELPA
jgi:GNAT superfamily N-acetyltransferase